MSYQGNGVYASANGMMMIKTVASDGARSRSTRSIRRATSSGCTVTANAQRRDRAPRRAAAARGTLGTKTAATLDVQFQGAGPAVRAARPRRRGRCRGGRLLDRSEEDREGDREAHQRREPDQRRKPAGRHDGPLHPRGPPQPLSDVARHKAVPMKLVSIVATHAATGQTIKVTDWTMAVQRRRRHRPRRRDRARRRRRRVPVRGAVHVSAPQGARHRPDLSLSSGKRRRRDI